MCAAAAGARRPPHCAQAGSCLGCLIAACSGSISTSKKEDRTRSPPPQVEAALVLSLPPQVCKVHQQPVQAVGAQRPRLGKGQQAPGVCVCVGGCVCVCACAFVCGYLAGAVNCGRLGLTVATKELQAAADVKQCSRENSGHTCRCRRPGAAARGASGRRGRGSRACGGSRTRGSLHTHARRCVSVGGGGGGGHWGVDTWHLGQSAYSRATLVCVCVWGGINGLLKLLIGTLKPVVVGILTWNAVCVGAVGEGWLAIVASTPW